MSLARRTIIGSILTTLCVAVGCVLVFRVHILESSKGERSFLLLESKALQIKLRESGQTISSQLLQQWIEDISRKSGTIRWRISAIPGILLETVRPYSDFRNANDKTEWFYCLDQQGRLILIDKAGKQSAVESTYFSTGCERPN